MPTPAINRDTIVTRPGHLITQSLNAAGQPVGLPVDSILRLVSELWDKELRPASGTVPFDRRYGWRPCRAWNHSGRYWYYPANVVRRFIRNGAANSRQTYEDGSFWGVAPPSVPTFPSGLINQAEVKALNKLKQQDFNLGQFIAEFGQTEKLVAGTILKIARDVRRFRRVNPIDVWRKVRAFEGGGAGNVLRRKIPSAWLELQYGWKPLMSDVNGALKYLARPGRDPFIHVKGYAKSEDAVPVTVNPVAGSSKAVLEAKVVQECWVSLYYLLTSPGLATRSSLGLVNPLEIVWECLPYSFVVDWFLPIGPWMSSLTADAGFAFKGGSLSRKSTVKDVQTRSVVFENNVVSSTNYVKAEGGGPSLQGSAYDFQRSCYTSSPVPGLYLKSPLSALHVANAFALLLQAFR